MNDNSEMMKILETIADRLVDMHLSNNRRFDDLAAQLEALLAVDAGHQLPLFAVAAAGPASVVPNEDEAMPVAEEDETPWPVDTRPILACCPTCGMTAYTEGAVEHAFGYRTPAGRPTIVQSWCRECRKLEAATSPRKKLPDSVTKFWREANALRKQADAKRAERVAVLEANRGRENKESVELVIEEADLRIEVRRLIAEYDKARRAFRKGESDDTGEN
jgi:hypothetical protein